MLILRFMDDEPDDLPQDLTIIDAQDFPAQEKSVCPLCGSEWT